jgi:hypothetical protein
MPSHLVFKQRIGSGVGQSDATEGSGNEFRSDLIEQRIFGNHISISGKTADAR